MGIGKSIFCSCVCVPPVGFCEFLAPEEDLSCCLVVAFVCALFVLVARGDLRNFLF